MKKIPLTKGKYALVDDQDYKKVNELKWYFEHGYARHSNPVLYMHRFILQAKKGQICDHKNGNKLDNRRVNLRFCSVSQNLMNAKRRKSNRSGYRGVSFDNTRHKWLAQIAVHKVNKHLGRFDSKKAAVIAYNMAAKQLFGEFIKK